MMVFICAIGMAFASVNIKPEPEPQTFDYILYNGSWLEIAEQPCNSGSEICQVKFEENGLGYPVYDEMDDDDPKNSTSPDPVLINR